MTASRATAMPRASSAAEHCAWTLLVMLGVLAVGALSLWLLPSA